MDNTTAKVSCFARAYHFENNKTHIFADSMAKKILGDDFDFFASGYDTFSLRNENAAVQVYELDLSDLLDDKKMRIGNAGLKTIAKFVPCDLAEESWVVKLLEKGFMPSEKSYGSAFI
ncbi:MAG: class I SAM-dependent methyltransferase [Eubacterium sp.]|nr:class I SAM-dependent methyltransferase [Eubacterium sp.]